MWFERRPLHRGTPHPQQIRVYRDSRSWRAAAGLCLKREREHPAHADAPTREYGNGGARYKAEWSRRPS
jgi:hypothetical protein